MKSIILFLACLLVFSTVIASELPAKGQISGTVRDVDNVPISEVTTHLFFEQSLNPIKTKFTDVEGTYVFNNLEPGSYKIRFIKPRLIPVWYDNASNQKTAKPIILLDSDAITIDAVMEMGGTITGRTTDLSGNPLVSPPDLFSHRGDGLVYQVPADRNGTYTFISLPSGQYSLRFQQPDKSYVWYGGDPSYKITVTAPETISDIDVVLNNSK